MKKELLPEELSALCLELSMLLHAGVSAGDGLSLMAQEAGGEQRELLESMARRADEGAPLSRTMRDAGRFPAYVCGLVEVGERTGRTEEALSSLSRYYEDRARLSRQVRDSLLYPAVMLVLMLVVIGVLLVKVLPIFDDVYASLGGRLTGVAGALLTLGQGLEGAMPVVWAVLAAVVVFLCVYAAVEPFRAKVSGLWRRLRGDRGVARGLNNARLAQALAMGMGSGLSMEESLELAAGLMDDHPAASARCRDCRARLESGQPLGQALRDSEILPAGKSRLVELGQRGGSADAAMAKAAADLTEESEDALAASMNRVEPTLVLVCAVLVGLILLSVMLPLMNIMSAIG